MTPTEIDQFIINNIKDIFSSKKQHLISFVNEVEDINELTTVILSWPLEVKELLIIELNGN